MQHITFMVFLGLIGGMISCFWTRVTGKRMILSFVHSWLLKLNRRRTLKTGKDDGHPLSNFLNCIFCLAPWIVFLLELFYIIEYNPWWIYALIGMFGGLGAGNFICEIVYTLRNEE